MEQDCLEGIGKVVDLPSVKNGDLIVGETGEPVRVESIDGRVLTVIDALTGDPEPIEVPVGVKVRRLS